MQNELHYYWDFFHCMLVKVVNLLQQTHHRVLGDAVWKRQNKSSQWNSWSNCFHLL